MGTFVNCGSRTSEGVRHITADSARGSYEVDGTGIEVGILSDSYDVAAGDATSAAQDIASGDIPGVGNPCGRLSPVENLDEINDASGAIDEGRGMAQIVHDLAPGAELSFASAFNGLFSFADNIAALRTAGAEVIVDDVIYFDEPMFQKGPVDIAVANVVTSGALYFTSAGNSNVIVGGNNVGSYEAPAYRPAGCPATVTAFNAGYGDCHDFDTSAGVDITDNITVNPGGGFVNVFQWAQPWNNVGTDFDVFLLNSATGAILAGSVDDQRRATLDGDPVRGLLLVEHDGVPDHRPGRARALVGRTGPEGEVPLRRRRRHHERPVQHLDRRRRRRPDGLGHSGTPDGFSVGAVRYDTRTTPETFSSRGPADAVLRPGGRHDPGSTARGAGGRCRPAHGRDGRRREHVLRLATSAARGGSSAPLPPRRTPPPRPR